MNRRRSTDRHSLRKKLRRIQALHDRATTPGERQAAAAALDRIRDRMERVDEGLPQPEGVITLEELGFTSSEPGYTLPDRAELIAMLLEWSNGDRTARSVGRWASRLVDKLLLPDLPATDPEAIPVEVLLQLSCMRRQPLAVQDIPAMLAFLAAPPDRAAQAWADWFAYVEGVDWRARAS
ncbi:MAG: hypothetical protein H6739_27650 [Alphaproteobacteria bacterium]|nr:hypothetical protein [Alphaproteobacteria bacterium]